MNNQANKYKKEINRYVDKIINEPIEDIEISANSIKNCIKKLIRLQDECNTYINKKCILDHSELMNLIRLVSKNQNINININKYCEVIIEKILHNITNTKNIMSPKDAIINIFPLFYHYSILNSYTEYCENEDCLIFENDFMYLNQNGEFVSCFKQGDDFDILMFDVPIDTKQYNPKGVIFNENRDDFVINFIRYMIRDINKLYLLIFSVMQKDGLYNTCWKVMEELYEDLLKNSKLEKISIKI